MIEEGYVLKARCIKNSVIASAPPYVREIWDWLVLNANHKDKRYEGFTVKRGQIFCKYSDIREALSWKIGYRKMMYHENHTKRAMKFLREHSMIELTIEPRGNLITIVNYDKYQTSENYERTDERTHERTNGEPMANQTPPPPLTRMKELKNERNLLPSVGASPTPAEEAREFFENTEKQVACVEMLVAKGLPEEVAKNEIDKFMRHWTEPTASGKRLRWQLEKTFEIKRRLITWLNNMQKFNSRASPVSGGLSRTNDPTL